MKYSIIKEILKSNVKGSFRSMTWEKELPVKKAFAGNVIMKRSSGVVRLGIDYDNIKAVQEKRAIGSLPEVNAGLPWGTWKAFPYLIEHKGNFYLRCAESKNNKIETQYFLNGRKVEKKDIENMCLKSAFTNHANMDVFNVNIENIISIR